ncbi:MAG: zf-HC2 domain-containing protein [Candidatus Poribacteria bacterium]
MKHCYKVRNLFGPYLYNTITPEERAEVDDHIKTCQKCSEDLRTRRMALDKVGVYKADSKNIDIDQERFMWNVYKKIAEDTIRQKRRQVTIRKFILQPAIATVAIAIIVTFGVAKFRSDNIPDMNIPTASIQTHKEVKEATKQIVKAKPMITEKTKQKSPVVSKNETKKPKPAINQPKPDVLTAKSELSNSRDWLMDADFIYFSLGDSRRALSKYDMIIDRYPNTEAAREAQKRINAIISSEYNTQDENIGNIELIKTGI